MCPTGRFQPRLWPRGWTPLPFGLASGCADPSPELDPVRCPVVLTVADWESFWGGPAGVVAAAADFHPTIFRFHGWHAWEPWGVCLRALRAVQNFLL